MANAVMSDWPSGVANTGWPSEPSAMLMPGRVQGWPAGTQRAANAAQRLLSQAVAWWDVGQFRDGDRFLRNRGTGGELLDLRLGSAAVANSNDPRFLAPEDTGYVYLPGVGGNYLSVPDENALDITGDTDLRMQVSMDTWTPSADNALISKRDGTGYSYLFQLLSNGTLNLTWTSDGSTTLGASSTASVGLAAGAVSWVRVTLDVDNGASGRTLTFYTSVDGSSWTQLGNAVTQAGTTSVFASTAPVWVGYRFLGNPLAGKVYRAQVLDGIDGTTVLDVDCDAITSGSAASFTAGTGQTVTINRSTSGRKSVAVPSRHKGGKPVMLFGTDDYLEVQDNWQHGLLNFGQGDSFTVLAIVRQHGYTATQVVLAKASDTSTAGIGFMLRNGTGTPAQLIAQDSDGTTLVAASSASRSTGLLYTLGMTRTSRTVTPWLNGTAQTAVTDATVNLSTSNAFRVGRLSGSGTNYADMEFYGAAIFRRALSAAEIKTLSDYFTGRIA